MTAQWVVVQVSGDRPDDTYVYGPLADRDTASRFADFLTTEVDPARAYELESPVPELLLFWNRQIKGELGESSPAPTADLAPRPMTGAEALDAATTPTEWASAAAGIFGALSQSARDDEDDAR